MDLFKTLYNLQNNPFIRKWKLFYIGLGFLDITAITLAFQLSYYINYLEYGGIFFEQKLLFQLYLAIVPIWLLLLYFINITEIPRTKRYSVLFIQYLQSAIFVGLIFLIIYFIFSIHPVSRRFIVGVCFFGFLFLFSFRVIEYKVFKIYRVKGYNFRKVVIIADDIAIPFIETLYDYKEWGYRVVAIFTESREISERFEESVYLTPWKSAKILNVLMGLDSIDEVFYFRKRIHASEIQNIIRYCEELGVSFNLRIEKPENKIPNTFMTTPAGEHFLTFTNIPHHTLALALKRFIDIVSSTVLILLFLPFILFISILIKITSPGPVIFRQERVGLRGRKFNLYKFRTMVSNAEELQKDLEDRNEADGPVFKIWDDPRATGIGKFLRRTGLDELPQLINVLKGEMSLVGPRPPLRSETRKYKRWQMRRLSVKPGLLCSWQVRNDRNHITFDEWMKMDLAYIDNWSLRLDFIILLRTIRTVF